MLTNINDREYLCIYIASRSIAGFVLYVSRFAVRGDETNPTIESAKEDAAKEAITWFQEMLV